MVETEQHVHGEKGVHCGGEWIPIEECAQRWNCSHKQLCHQKRQKAADSKYDVIVIGSGCVGACIARELAKYDVTVCVVEQADDVSNGGATKANSGIVHAGYDDKPGTMRARFCWTGNQMFPALDKDLHFGFHRTGSLVVARSESEMEILSDLMRRGEQNGVKNLRIVQKEELKKMEPFLSEDAIAALYSPDAGTVTPYEFAIAVAENAADNGVEFKFNTKVQSIEKREDHFEVKARSSVARSGISLTMVMMMAVACVALPFLGSLNEHLQNYGFPIGMALVAVAGASAIFRMQASEKEHVITGTYIVNAGGNGSDKIANMVGINDYKMKPRLGDYLLLNKDQGQFCRHIIFPAPGKYGKGIVTQPTLWGNLLLGPTARDLHDSEKANQSPESIMKELIQKCRQMIPKFDAGKVIHSFAGIRAKSTKGDWIVEHSKVDNFFQAAAIDSPGLAGSPAIAVHIVDLLHQAGLSKRPYNSFDPIRKGIIVPKDQWKGLSTKNIDPGKKIICICERVTEKEITDAINRSLPCHSTQAVRKRTRAGMGHCQGDVLYCHEYIIYQAPSGKRCEAQVKGIIEKETGLKVISNDLFFSTRWNNNYILGRSSASLASKQLPTTTLVDR
eukprot:m.91926 g.91926  ORF g.91926 m.91926 type:complete len:619 (+) comp13322_c0_seq2:111-1967(+)